ncbi:MAG TPA: squalene/phytoene synthase family protein, partial [Verrucomicrobiae bacterium]|nr:squalene/phytoene synthase family protein [Verrucomicrobiae bacterium]
TDAERGRIYLPIEELRRCGVSEEQILRFEDTPGFRRAAEAVAARARAYYRGAREALPPEDRRSMIAAEGMGTVYWRLLEKLEARHFDVLGPDLTRVSKPQKAFLMLRTWWRFFFAAGTSVPNYGTS